MGKPTKKSKVEEEEEEVEVPIDVDEEEEDDLSMGEQFPDESDRVMQERVLEEILDHARQAPDGEKLTWNAIYSLKQKEIDLTIQMTDEIEKIKEKYELLKQPLHHQISAAVLGEKLEDSLYALEGVQSKIKKGTTPQKIESFWGIVLDKEGLLTEEVDVDCINKLKEFKVETLCHKNSHLRITFKFNEETDYFKNRQLCVESHFDEESGEPVRELKEEIVYKKERVEHSLFTLLFDSKTDINQFYNVAGELYQDYSNALFFYFREEEEEQNVINEEDEEDEEDDDQVEDVKPKKKAKSDKPAATQKPECKNQ